MSKTSTEAMLFINGLATYLKSRIIGQDHVIEAISEKLRYWYLGVGDPSRPTTFFFLGPTGSGKTELIRETIRYLYGIGDKQKLLRLDMSEFGKTAGADVGKKLIGYSEHDPGRLYEFLENNTEGAILYDEFEKAHPDMAKYMLQQLDAGRVTLWNNKTYDISRFLLFYTSNVGAEIFQGNNHLSIERKSEAACQRLVMIFDSPEFVARFGKFNYGIFAFNALKPEHLRLIARKFIDDKLQHFRTIREHRHECGGFVLLENMDVLGYSPEVVDFALLQTNTTRNGAREIRDVVERMLNQAYIHAIANCHDENPITGYLHVEPNTDKLILSQTPPVK
ncbi:MAG: ATP-dependent Clp protease ATP-binding subunit [Victivallales bacterium]|nr:ATP-dependent Clp protease ATP-binding subunit [Victivallales bacterium]